MHCFGGLFRLVFLCLLPLIGACELDSIVRFEVAEALAFQRFGEDDRMKVTIGPGRIETVEEVESTFVVSAVAGGPFPQITLNNGTTAAQTITLALGNVNSWWTFSPRLNALPSSERKAPECATDALEGRASITLAPSIPSSVLGTTVQIGLELPACTQVVLRAQPAPTSALVRVAVIGEIDQDPSFLNAAINRAVDLGVDYIQFLGNVGFLSDATVFGEFESTVQDSGVPYGVIVAPDDTFSPTEFVQRFGGSDYVTEVGTMRWIALDTASGELTDEQLALVTGLPERRPPGIFLSSIALLDFATTDGLRSTALGARLVEELASRGVLLALSSGGPEHGHRQFGEVEFRDLASAAARPTSIAIVEFRRPWPELNRCTTSVDCAGDDTCDRGFCRSRCTSDAGCETSEGCTGGFCAATCSEDTDCAGPLPSCAAGFCEEDPEIRLSLSRL